MNRVKEVEIVGGKGKGGLKGTEGTLRDSKRLRGREGWVRKGL